MPFPWVGAVLGGGAILDYFGQRQSAKDARTEAENNRNLQEEFAQNGIRWRVEDAKAAGLHPLYALGANTASYSPIAVGDTGGGSALSSIGQNISRAVQTGMTLSERKHNAVMNQFAVERASLENQILKQQLSGVGNATNPPFPSANASNFIPTSQDVPAVRVVPAERTVSQPGRLAQEAGWRPDVSYSRTDTGLAPMIPNSLSESLEDDIIGNLFWRLRNQGFPNLGIASPPPKSQLPRGANHWEWSAHRQEWQPIYSTKTWINRLNDDIDAVRRATESGDLRRNFKQRR